MYFVHCIYNYYENMFYAERSKNLSTLKFFGCQLLIETMSKILF